MLRNLHLVSTCEHKPDSEACALCVAAPDVTWHLTTMYRVDRKTLLSEAGSRPHAN
jgi:hypothetical protein